MANPRWPPLVKHNVMSRQVDLNENIFGRTFYPHCQSFYTCQPIHGPEDRKKKTYIEFKI